MAVRIVIEVNEAGQMHMEGPLNDRILCYGILEAAKDLLRTRAATQDLSRIVPVSVVPAIPRNGR